MITLGLISDTHGAVHPAIHAALGGVDEILHAGDVGSDAVLAEIGTIAPVITVVGNTDMPVRWPDERLLHRGARRILLVHDIGRVYEPSLDFMSRAAHMRADVVVFGHSHQPADFHIGPIRYVNPGSAGPSRGGPPTVARLTLSSGEVEVVHLELE